MLRAAGADIVEAAVRILLCCATVRSTRTRFGTTFRGAATLVNSATRQRRHLSGNPTGGEDSELARPSPGEFESVTPIRTLMGEPVRPPDGRWHLNG